MEVLLGCRGDDKVVRLREERLKSRCVLRVEAERERERESEG